ncbi:hypothetical protein [Treponema sp.]|uniref:hypothetical protein n=1 Tax=Treponema sp. TaxID=166 RepID=UPI0025F6ABC9|nr:hypothetical protein [Treponema sp.]MCR5218147.1 hypothetical protein [Treponema sp.]
MKQSPRPTTMAFVLKESKAQAFFSANHPKAKDAIARFEAHKTKGVKTSKDIK